MLQLISLVSKSHFAFANPQMNVNSNSGPKLLKKFYKLATIENQQNPEHPTHLWQIKLDGKNVRTPSKHLLAMPTPMLAHLIANEFNMQKDFIRPSTMPLLQMARSSIDSNKDERLRKYIIPFLYLRYLEESFVNFLQNDTLLFRESPEKKLYKVQSEKLDPLLQDFNKRFGMNLVLNEGFDVTPLTQADRLKITTYVESLDSWQLIPLQSQAENLKSVILAILLANQNIDINAAVALSRLEEQYQIDTFGMVEGHHDVDENNVLVQSAASILFSQMINQQTMLF